MPKGLGRIGMAAASVALFAACSGEEAPLGPGAGELSTNEAAAVSDAIVELAFDGWDFGQATTAQAPAVGGDELSMSVAGAPIDIDYSVDVSTQCELGGTFNVGGSISGSIDDQTFAGTLALDVSTGMVDCAFPADGKSFTLNTNPDLNLSGSVAWDQTGLVGESTFTYAGGIGWVAADGREGSCAVDVLVTMAQGGSSVSSGTICGVSISNGSL